MFGGLVISRGRQKLVLVTRRALNPAHKLQGFSDFRHTAARAIYRPFVPIFHFNPRVRVKSNRADDTAKDNAPVFLCFLFFLLFFSLSLSPFFFVFLSFIPMSNGISKYQSDSRSSGPNMRGRIPTLTFSRSTRFSTNNKRDKIWCCVTFHVP